MVGTRLCSTVCRLGFRVVTFQGCSFSGLGFSDGLACISFLQGVVLSLTTESVITNAAEAHMRMLPVDAYIDGGLVITQCDMLVVC